MKLHENHVVFDVWLGKQIKTSSFIMIFSIHLRVIKSLSKLQGKQALGSVCQKLIARKTNLYFSL